MSATTHPTHREYPSDIAFTSAVKAIQNQKGSRGSYCRMERSSGWQTSVTPDLVEFLADLDMFYLGTANAVGQPYIQYRGGPPGFLKVLDDPVITNYGWNPRRTCQIADQPVHTRQAQSIRGCGLETCLHVRHVLDRCALA